MNTANILRRFASLVPGSLAESATDEEMIKVFLDAMMQAAWDEGYFVAKECGDPARIPDDDLRDLRESFDLEELVCEWANVSEASIEDDGSVWVGGADGDWLSEERIHDLMVWLIMRRPPEHECCDGCGRMGDTWQWRRFRVLCAKCLREARCR